MTFKKRTLIIPKRLQSTGFALPIAPYTSLTDAFLTTPDPDLEQDDCFIPFICKVSENNYDLFITTQSGDTDNGKLNYKIEGSDVEPITLVGLFKTIIGQGEEGSVFDGIFLYKRAPGNQTYAPAIYNGLQRLWLPGTINDDKLGGYIEFYYHQEAFEANEEDEDFNGFEISQNGSVYESEGIGDDTKLIVRWDGTVGQMGGGSLISDTIRIV